MRLQDLPAAVYTGKEACRPKESVRRTWKQRNEFGDFAASPREVFERSKRGKNRPTVKLMGWVFFSLRCLLCVSILPQNLREWKTKSRQSVRTSVREVPAAALTWLKHPLS